MKNGLVYETEMRKPGDKSAWSQMTNFERFIFHKKKKIFLIYYSLYLVILLSIVYFLTFQLFQSYSIFTCTTFSLFPMSFILPRCISITYFFNISILIHIYFFLNLICYLKFLDLFLCKTFRTIFFAC